MKMKTCNKCKVEKTIHDFHRAAKSWDGFQGICIACTKEKSEQTECVKLRRMFPCEYGMIRNKK
jgi:hypothetical protein